MSLSSGASVCCDRHVALAARADFRIRGRCRSGSDALVVGAPYPLSILRCNAL